MSDVPARLVIFDCDGVLVDSERLSIGIEVQVFADLGLQMTEADVVRDFVGRSDEAVRAELSRRLGWELAPDWDDAYADEYLSTFENELVPVDGIVDALDAVDAMGLATCVASSGTHRKMDFTLGLTGLKSRFEGRIHSATEVERGKPHPDLFLYAAERMGFDPSACTVIEDSRPGVDAALAAEMRVLAYGGGVTPAERLAGDGVEVFTHMRELPSLLR